jgi:hypothetical protein
MRWFLQNRTDVAHHVSYMERAPHAGGEIRLLAIPSRERLLRVLRYVLDENEFLSPHGVRSLSRVYREPYEIELGGRKFCIGYEPAESQSSLFGGNSNWRGPVWMPINYLLIEALERYHHFYGENVRVECPTGSGNFVNLKQVAIEISARLTRLFLPDAVPATARIPGSSMIRTGAISCSSTNTSTATPARGSARRTRPAGARW